MIHLDTLFWGPGWEPRPQDEWRRIQEGLVEAERWVIDGNHEPTLDVRLGAADAIVLLDYGRLLCTWRVLRRWYHFRRKPRPDRGRGCDERLDRDFLRFVWTYPRSGRVRAVEAVEAVERHAPGARFIRLSSRRAARQFLEELVPPPSTGRLPKE